MNHIYLLQLHLFIATTQKPALILLNYFFSAYMCVCARKKMYVCQKEGRCPCALKPIA